MFHLLIILQGLLLSPAKKSRNVSAEAGVQQLIEATIFVLQPFTKTVLQLQK